MTNPIPIRHRTVAELADEMAGPLFIAVSTSDLPTTYGALAAAIRVHHLAIGDVLDEINARCTAARIPLWGAHVVSIGTYEVGDGWYKWSNEPPARARRSAHDWYRALTAEELGNLSAFLHRLGIDRRPPIDHEHDAMA